MFGVRVVFSAVWGGKGRDSNKGSQNESPAAWMQYKRRLFCYCSENLTA